MKLNNLKEELGAERLQSNAYESEVRMLVEALGFSHNFLTVDTAADNALAKIQALLYVAFELSAHADCTCEESDKNLCLTCICNECTKGMQASAQLDQPNQYITKGLQEDVIHGENCPKVLHTKDGYMHDEQDDSPYSVDGQLYCGRCHHGL